MLDVCWFASLGDPAEVRSRFEAVKRFYAPLGLTHTALLEAPGVVVGALAPRPLGEVAFGGGLPRGPAAVAEPLGDGFRLRTGTAACTTLYACGARAWSTHAVAAALIGAGRASIRPEALAELCAFEYCPGDATVLEGVTAVESGTVIDLRDGRATERRKGTEWERLPEEEAREEAGRRLVVALGEWIAAAAPGVTTPITLGLSAGLDSRVAAVALREAGVAFRAVTFGEWEAEGAAEVARVLGVPHEVVVEDGPPSDPLLAARWSDGAAPILATFVAGTPERFADGVHVTGGGGEAGRAFHYALLARAYRRPQLERVWRPSARLHGAAPEAIAHVDAEARAMLDRARERTGRDDGWRPLDVIYVHERMRKWGRARMSLGSGTLVPALLDPGVAAALVSMPLADRVEAGFHRGFLEKHAPELVPPPPPAQRRGVPAPLRRLAAARRRRADPLGTGTGTAPPLPHDVEAFLLDGALDPQSTSGVLGEPFLERLRNGVRTKDAHATTLALQLGGAAAFENVR